MADDSSGTVLNHLLSSLPATTEWPSLLMTTLAENLTTWANSTELLVSQGGLSDLTATEGYTLGRCDNGSEIFNCTVQEYMEYMRGPQTLPLQQAIFVSRHLMVVIKP